MNGSARRVLVFIAESYQQPPSTIKYPSNRVSYSSLTSIWGVQHMETGAEFIFGLVIKLRLGESFEEVWVSV